MKFTWASLILMVLLLAACTTAPETTQTPEEVSTATPAIAVTSPPTIPPHEFPPSFEAGPLPLERGELFAGSGNCVSCHNSMSDESGADVSIDRMWRSAMMANAARDPYWQASVRAEVISNPSLSQVIEDKCSTCHTPMAHTEKVAAGGEGSLLNGGFLSPDHPLHPLAIDSVSCNTCHQIRSDNFGQTVSFSGGYSIDDQLPFGEREAFGPFVIEAEQASIMQNVSGFVPLLGSHIEQPELCATCHTLFTPYLDASGEIVGEFPEQTVYLEWKNSAFEQAETCQGCHMPEARGGVMISTTGGVPRSPFFQHRFVGGNAYMMRIFGEFGPEMSVTASSEQFSDTLAGIEDQLQNRTVSLALENVRLEGGRLLGRLKVENLAGHKFPSGFPSRRAWLHITVRDTSGEVVFESGALNPNGAIQGNDNDADPKSYEPHHPAIGSPDQVQIYEGIMVNTEGEVTTMLLRAASYIKDNRLLPAGFDKTEVAAEIAPYGSAVEDTDFLGGGDVLELNIDLSDFEGPFEVTVELLYQSIGFTWSQKLRNFEAPEVGRFLEYYAAIPNLPVAVASITATVE